MNTTRLTRLSRSLSFTTTLATVIASSCLIGCGPKAGQDYVGKWCDVTDAKECVEISRAGDAFIVHGKTDLPATYQDGALSVSSGFQTKLVLDKSSGLLVGSGFKMRKVN